MPITTIATIVLSALALTVVRPRRRTLRPRYEDLIDSLSPQQILRLSDFIDDEDFWSRDFIFWEHSDGLRGVYRRWVNMTILVQLCQLAYADGKIGRDQAWYLVRNALFMTFFTVIACPEAAFCLLWKELPHISSRVAFHFYCQISARTVVLCTDGDVPEYMFNLQKLI